MEVANDVISSAFVRQSIANKVAVKFVDLRFHYCEIIDSKGTHPDDTFDAFVATTPDWKQLVT